MTDDTSGIKKSQSIFASEKKDFFALKLVADWFSNYNQALKAQLFDGSSRTLVASSRRIDGNLIN